MTFEHLGTVLPESYVPLREQVYKLLRDAIASGKLKPGDHLGEEKMCGLLGVSRSPLREALRTLEEQGLVRMIPRKGAVVTEVTDADLAGLFAVRRELDGMAARLAAQYASREDLEELDQICRSIDEHLRLGDMAAVVKLHHRFHERVAAFSQNKWLASLLTGLRAHTQRAFGASIPLKEWAALEVAEHREIVATMRSRDPLAAERLMEAHVARIGELALSTFGKEAAGPETAEPELTPGGHRLG